MRYDKIIWISLDTLRADCIKFNKNKLYTNEYLPTIDLERSKLDEICEKGFFFNNVISVAPYTSSSHAAYFTGLWPKNNGVYDQFNSKLRAKTVFQIAKKSGYKTIFKTDFPFVLGKYLNMVKGVDTFIVENNSKTLKEIKKNKKIFAFIHFGQIHYPYGFHNLSFGGQNYLNKIKFLEKKYKIKSKFIDLEDMAIETFRTKKDLALLYRYKKIISFLYSKKLDNDLFNLYLEGINYFHKNFFNHFLVNLLKIVDKENYLLIISSDHGEAWNNYTYGHHNSLDEGVIRVPILFYAKDIPTMVYSNRIRTIDVAPTLNDIIFKSKNVFDGESLKKIIYNGTKEDSRFAFSAVWINETKDVLHKIKNLLKKDKISTKKNQSIRYSAAIYDKEFKYVVNYKKFINRTEKISNWFEEQLFKINSLTNIKKEKNTSHFKKYRRLTKKYNTIKIQNNKTKKKSMLKYFNFMGYKI